MKNYLFNCEEQEKIWERLIQLKALAMLINEATSPETDNRNDNVSTCSWMIAELLDEIIESLENLPAAEKKKNEK